MIEPAVAERMRSLHREDKSILLSTLNAAIKLKSENEPCAGDFIALWAYYVNEGITKHGRIDFTEVDPKCLQNNPALDPIIRAVYAYIDGTDEEREAFKNSVRQLPRFPSKEMDVG